MRGHGVADLETLKLIEDEWNKAFGPKTLGVEEMAAAEEAKPL